MGKDDAAMEFLTKLKKDDVKKYDSIKTRIKAVAKYDDYQNPITFRSVGGGVFEFKRPGIRLYAFYDDLDGEEHLILCTNGGKKNKRQQNDIETAKQLRLDYYAAKELPDTTLHLIETDE